MVRGSWIKAGAVVIDVGINSVDDASVKKGYRLVGDAHFAECKEVHMHINSPPIILTLLYNAHKPSSHDINISHNTHNPQVASQITPVPGGVGPMTIAMLMRNTVNGCRRTAEAAAARPTPP
jgi:5,10-methylene-tetrahydrofolate dehydrogenase/methenyl tetrahydrofolate cyclohydrolase